MKAAGGIEQVIISLLGSRDAEASICPSEVARRIGGEDGPWRTLMEPVRIAAAKLAERRIVRVTQGAKEVDMTSPIKGPLRIRRGANWTSGQALTSGDSTVLNAATEYPTTPDRRYFVVRGRLWRKANPDLPAHVRDALIKNLMDARRALRGKRSEEERAAAREQVDEAKRALGERGPVWWTDGAPDFNRYLAKNTPYWKWFAQVA